MKIKLLILLCCIVDIVLWIGMIALIVESSMPIHWMLFAAFFGGLLIVIFGGWVCQNLAISNKKRHATLLTPEELREQLRKFMVV
jgi:arginine exporter protein ArgO